MTDAELEPGDGVWDDGEWISWEWINDHLDDEPDDDEPAADFDDCEKPPKRMLEQWEILHDLVDCAQRHFENTGRYLQIWGELGEIYAEVKFGLSRHAPHCAGSDGTIAGRRVEVKTISPEKRSDRVLVKRQGDFEQLLIVSIDPDFQFRSKLFERSELKGQTGRFLRGRLRSDDSDP